jgi:hypothetical protein
VCSLPAWPSRLFRFRRFAFCVRSGFACHTCSIHMRVKLCHTMLCYASSQLKL